jgi:O-antigen/teichoic acid export membrane protein
MGALMNARQRMDVSGALAIAVRLIALISALPALANGFGVAGVLACNLGAGLLGMALHGAVLYRWRMLPYLRWDFAAWRIYLVKSYPFALTAVIAALYTRADVVLLGLWQGDVAAGWYGAAYKLWEAVGLLPVSLLDAMFPEMARLSGSQHGTATLRSLFRTGGPVLLAGGLLLAAAGALAARGLITGIYGVAEDFEPTIAAFRLLVWGVPAMFLYLLSGHALYALGEQRRVTIAMLVVGLANLTANAFVIPRWGTAGAAVAALCSEWLLWALLYPQARRALGLQRIRDA